MKQQGIYQIKNIINGKIYLGSSCNLQRRKADHYFALRHNKHYNLHLQQAWNKYKEENFKFEIIELTEDLETREQIWLDETQAFLSTKGYNILKQAYSPKGHTLTPEQSLKISIALKNKPKSQQHKQALSKCRKNKTYEELMGIDEAKKQRQLKRQQTKGVNNPKARAIAMYSIIGEYIKTFSYMKEAKIFIGKGDIQYAVKNFNRVAGGYKWKYL